MKRRAHDVHDSNLEILIRNLDKVGENPTQIRGIIKEPTLFLPNSINLSRSCDLILMYDDKASLHELKGSDTYRAHALTQLRSTEEFMRQLGYKHPIKQQIDYYSMDEDFMYELIQSW